MDSKKILFLIDDKILTEKLLSLFKEYSTNLAYKKNECISLLKSNPYTVLITDVDLNKRENIDFLKQIKSLKRDTAIIIVTEENNIPKTVEALKYGAFNFFTKPIDKNEISSSVKEIFKMKAILERTRDVDYYLVSMKKLYQIPNDINLISDLATTLSRDLIVNKRCDEDEIINVDLALVEILTNAVEHGNLEIDYNEKMELISKNSHKYAEELEKRSKTEPYCNRKVTAEAFYDREKVTYVITDQGKGFDYKNIQKKIKSNDLLRISGRGIIMAFATLDEVIYEGKGNKVTLKKYFNKKQKAQE